MGLDQLQMAPLVPDYSLQPGLLLKEKFCVATQDIFRPG